MMQNKSFYAHHSAFGSFSSFLVGKLGMGGGFVNSDVRPPDNDVLIGVKQDSEIRLLPFCRLSEGSAEEEFTGETATVAAVKRITLFQENEIERSMGWASDQWTAGSLEFTLLTPFGRVDTPDRLTIEEQKFAFAPVLFAQLSYDNNGRDTDAELIFGVEGLKRRLSITMGEGYLGAACERRYGFAAVASEEIRELSRLDILGSWAYDNYQNHDLGRAPSLIFKVPAGEKRSFTIALATWQEGRITTGLDTEFFYSGLFEDLEDVLAYGLQNVDRYLELARARDSELEGSGLNEHRQFLVAHATHSYHASSQLMRRPDGSPLWILNEGEYIMMNTFDLTVDHVFYELRFHPWTIENTLELFLERYSYRDQAGLAFTHDMGVANGFTPEGISSYELPLLSGCFSYMTHEELLNWVLTALVYAHGSGNVSWLTEKQQVLLDCLESLMARDANRDGIMDVDSSRCQGGAEITTYDSLDTSLGQSRNNLYLGVKSWAAYVLLEAVLRETAPEAAELALNQAKAAAATIAGKFDAKQQYIPAVFEHCNSSRIIPAVEALIYPYFCGLKQAVAEDGPYGELIKVLKLHIRTVLKPGICIDPISGGWKLSSTSINTWNSKIFLCQHVVKVILGLDFDGEQEWDRVHAYWQQASCSLECATDQVNSDTGTGRGSRLYPRLVTSILWMK